MKKILISLIVISALLMHSFISNSKNIVDIATENKDFSILVQALTRSDLDVNFVDVLSGDGPFTVFAPTNQAFANLLGELGASSMNDIDASTLKEVLKMHVVSGEVKSGDLSEGLTASSLVGEDLSFSLTDGANITDPNGRVINITGVDVDATNGVVHIVDKVILPEQSKKASSGCGN